MQSKSKKQIKLFVSYVISTTDNSKIIYNNSVMEVTKKISCLDDISKTESILEDKACRALGVSANPRQIRCKILHFIYL